MFKDNLKDDKRKVCRAIPDRILFNDLVFRLEHYGWKIGMAETISFFIKPNS